MFKLTYILLLLTQVFPVEADSKYNLQDLEALVQDRSFDEFFDHALDVRPSERLEAWQAMITTMGDHFTRKVLVKPEITREQFNRVETLFSWPVLRKDDLFKSRRQEIGLFYLKNCLKNADEVCWSDLKSFWEANTEDADTAFKLSELTLKYKNSPLSQWTFLEVAVKSPLSEFYCKKQPTLDAVWDKLALDYIRLGTKGNFLRKIDETVHPECLKSLNQQATLRLFKPNHSSGRELAFQILFAQGKISQEMEDFFYSVYLLENPSKGDLFNISWNRMTELSKHSHRREAVLQQLMKLDPLPDELFSSLDLSKKKVILNHFKMSFPEYLNYYVDQCLNFYNGKGTFRNGNPTMNCQHLMNSELSSLFVTKEQVDAYTKARNI